MSDSSLRRLDFLVSAWVGAVDGVAVTVEIRLLRQVRVPRQEAPEQRVVVPRPHLLQRRPARRPEPVRAVAALRAPAVGVPRTPARRGSQAVAREHSRPLHVPGGVGRLAGRPQAIGQQGLAAAAHQPVPVQVHARGRLVRLRQRRVPVELVVEAGRPRLPPELPV